MYLLFIVIGAVFIIRFDHLDLHRYFNAWVGELWANRTFMFLTYLGDGYFTLLVALLIVFFYSVRNGLFILSAYLISGGITQTLKYVFFDEVNRPFYYYSYSGLQLNIVEGVDMHIHNSFPSGHATAAFSLFFCLSIFTHSQGIKIFCFFMALLVAFSRVYLSQHFFEDIYAGSIIAMFTASALSYLYYYNLFLKRTEKLNRSLWIFIKRL